MKISTEIDVSTEPREFLLQVLETLPAAAYTCDLEGRITFYNRKAKEFWGREPLLRDDRDRFCGSYRLFSPDGTPIPHDDCWMALTLRDGCPHNGEEVMIERPDGERRMALIHVNPLIDDRRRLIGATNVLVDITERKRTEQLLAFQATHDALTDLPNRVYFLERLNESLATVAPESKSTALLLLDLDRFKEINDTCGHPCGDEVLRRIGPRLQRLLEETDTVARLGGDEFGIVLPGADRERASDLAERIIRSVSKPVFVGRQSFDIGVSIGLAMFPDDGQDPATLLSRADVALYSAKRRRTGWAFSVPQSTEDLPNRSQLARAFRRSLDRGTLALHYQPKLELRSSRIVGVEALCRWPQDTGGMIPPSEFMPMAEQFGLLRGLALWSIRQAQDQARAWRELGLQFDIAVNFAPENLLDDSLITEVVRLLRRSEAMPSRLTIEVTERAVLSDPAKARASLARLKDLGVRVALDDLGTGYSSLTWIRELPVDELKIDGSFIQDLDTNECNACIVKAVIDLGHNLGLNVVAEGVESAEAMEHLVTWGCDEAQGYFFTPPLPASALLEWISSRTLSLTGSPLGAQPDWHV